jgi:hypothetical protein
MPAAGSDILIIERDETGNVTSVRINPAWAAAFQLVFQNAYVATRNGPTAERPTSSTIGRFVGMPFFDTTLGLPVFLKTASSSAWVKADGTPA